MPNDLTSSPIDRQNVLNNRYALERIEEHLALGGLEFEGDRWFTKQQLIEMYEVSDTTVERYIKNHGDELKANGYQLLKGKKLNEVQVQYEDFIKMASGEKLNPSGEIAAFAGISQFPSRVKCAVLAWKTFNAAIAGADNTISTE